jgi:hypothetical protein
MLAKHSRTSAAAGVDALRKEKIRHAVVAVLRAKVQEILRVKRLLGTRFLCPAKKT